VKNKRLVLTALYIVFALGADGQGSSAKPPFTIIISIETPTVKAGSRVEVNGRLTNTSKRPLDASGCYCGPSGLDTYLTWEVRDDKGNFVAKRVYPHPEPATGSAILDRIIKPGESIGGGNEISRLYDMTKPGQYAIQASRATTKEMGGGVVKSNVVLLTVTP
jgi:hypothetical protein